jgi:hypothetical protein
LTDDRRREAGPNLPGRAGSLRTAATGEHQSARLCTYSVLADH